MADEKKKDVYYEDTDMTGEDMNFLEDWHDRYVEQLQKEKAEKEKKSIEKKPATTQKPDVRNIRKRLRGRKPYGPEGTA